MHKLDSKTFELSNWFRFFRVIFAADADGELFFIWSILEVSG